MPFSSVTSLLLLQDDDNVAVATRVLERGEKCDVAGNALVTTDSVPQGHKVALRSIAAGDAIIKYGQVIGFATAPINAGAWVHSHNLEAGVFKRNAESCTAIPRDPLPLEGQTFLGYRRPNGKAGTRNYLAIISNVNCSASVSRAVARRFDAAALKAFSNIDGVVAFTHGGGCGLHYGSEHHEALDRTLGGIARHPNIGGYLLIGLGCETATMGHLIDTQKLHQLNPSAGGSANSVRSRPTVLSMQDMGGTQRTVDEASRLVSELLPHVNDVHREPISASELIVGTNCGGSDGNSGISANPALGIAADMLVAAGGTAVLAETTEIYGAEQLLTRRARTPQVAEALLERIRWWEWYTGLFGSTPDNNPSPGNKAGGLTTIYEKSLGAVAKGGSTALNAVYKYAEEITAKGLVVMDTPGFDPVSVTGIVAGGAQVMVFTTGRGSCFGCKPTPSIKVASNTPMYDRMQGDMDINAGEVLSGKSVAEVGRDIFDEILAVASGKRTKSEQLGIGDEEFVPWSIGPIL